MFVNIESWCIWLCWTVAFEVLWIHTCSGLTETLHLKIATALGSELVLVTTLSHRGLANVWIWIKLLVYSSEKAKQKQAKSTENLHQVPWQLQTICCDWVRLNQSPALGSGTDLANISLDTDRWSNYNAIEMINAVNGPRNIGWDEGSNLTYGVATLTFANSCKLCFLWEPFCYQGKHSCS